MNFKSKKFLIPVISILILSIGFGAFLGRYYFTAKNLEIDMQNVKIISYAPVTISNPNVDIKMDLEGTVKSTTALDVSVDSLTYTMEINGVDFGSGEVESFIASKIPSPLIIHHNAENLGLGAGIVIAELLLGNNITVEIMIISITIMGITFKPNSVSSFELNIDDL